MKTDEYGYVIRCVDLEGSGTVTYRGMNETIGKSKETVPNRKTYTLTGARRAVTGLRNRYPSMDFCIE